MSAADFVLFGLLALLGVLGSALFSGIETGLYTINRVRLAVRADRGDPRARRLRSIIGTPNRMLATLLIGNNIANYAGSFGVAAILDGLGYTPVQAIIINIAMLIPLLFVFGEILPKDLFRTHTDHWSYRCSAFLMIADRVLTWSGLTLLVRAVGEVLGRLLDTDSAAALGARQRISRLIKEGLGAGVLTESQTTLADRALLLRDCSAGTEMVPWSNVVAVSQHMRRADLNDVMQRHGYTRLPVTDDAGHVIGIVTTLDAVVHPDRPVAELTRSPLTIPPAMPVRQALRLLRTKGQRMAIVVDERTDAPLGLVTFKDLVEPLTGELAAW